MLGAYLGECGVSLVYGGCSLGLMEALAESAHQAGAHIVGVVPSKVEENGHTSKYIDEVVMCENLSDRKQIMMDRSDIFIALPGGLGTLDEIFTVAASQTIGYHNKKVILYNVNGFWNSCIAMLDDLQRSGMMRRAYSNQIMAVESIDDIDRILNPDA